MFSRAVSSFQLHNLRSNTQTKAVTHGLLRACSIKFGLVDRVVKGIFPPQIALFLQKHLSNVSLHVYAPFAMYVICSMSTAWWSFPTRTWCPHWNKIASLFMPLKPRIDAPCWEAPRITRLQKSCRILLWKCFPASFLKLPGKFSAKLQRFTAKEAKMLQSAWFFSLLLRLAKRIDPLVTTVYGSTWYTLSFISAIYVRKPLSWHLQIFVYVNWVASLRMVTWRASPLLKRKHLGSSLDGGISMTPGVVGMWRNDLHFAGMWHSFYHVWGENIHPVKSNLEIKILLKAVDPDKASKRHERHWLATSRGVLWI